MPNVKTTDESTRSPIDGTEYVRLATPGANWKATTASLVGALTPLVRTKLTGNTTYYVATTGSDVTGDGSVSKPWATPQYAGDWLTANIDTGGFNVTVQVGDGQYPGPELGKLFGGGFWIWKGHVGNQDLVIFDDTGSGFTCIDVFDIGQTYTFSYLTLKITPSGDFAALSYDNISNTVSLDHITFDSTEIDIPWYGGAIIFDSEAFCQVIVNAGIVVKGNWGAFVSGQGAYCQAFFGNCDITLVGTPNWITAFMALFNQTFVNTAFGLTTSGASTGPRFDIGAGSVVIAGGDLNIFPGNSPGVFHAGSTYA